ncbi:MULTISPECIES: hypothetical protein [Tenacibaculum]|uniref:hypothetical protein n=1 Tax=Tenacibaculum TaxID=104267 RepID=UPI001F0A7CC5|nr:MULTISPECIES: hypothetical protein [Tenacibaculum]MCH3880747.1 hypothetical protein [Tenacibaculum aquimarinum]MCH3884372.1 hypothetical protein [Tenacibaculum aquimarinum]MDO6599654.1 hypothetical protein [Tenacibaculum sp. 1_MG-2023]
MRKILIILTVLCFSNKIFACDCEWGGNFMKLAPLSELVVKGKVIEHVYHTKEGKRYFDFEKFNEAQIENEFDNSYDLGESIRVEIIEVIKGKENRRIIEIFDTDGADCRASIQEFKKGKTYIFATYKPKRTGFKLPNETENDYALEGCFESSLKYFPKTNEVFGMIKGKSYKRKNRRYSYQKLKKKLLCQ